MLNLIEKLMAEKNVNLFYAVEVYENMKELHENLQQIHKLDVSSKEEEISNLKEDVSKLKDENGKLKIKIVELKVASKSKRRRQRSCSNDQIYIIKVAK